MPTNNSLYRTICFRNGAHTSGYPVPHLLAMEFVQLPNSTRGKDSEIRLYFSSECVQVEGYSLRLLWETLVCEMPEEIKLGTGRTDEGEYTVTNLILP
jgi:hypothetical protein